MTRKLTYLYFLLLPFTSAFAITEVVSICLVILVVLILILAFDIYQGKSMIYISVTDGILLSFWLITAISFILNIGIYASNKPYNHIFAYTYVIIGNYFLLKNILLNQFKRGELSFEKVTYFIGVGVLITSIFGLVEFFSKNVFFINIDDYIPRAAVQGYEPLTASLIRIRSFIEESGHLAFYYEVLGPIGLYGLRKFKKLFYSTLISMIMCFLLSFSTAGWIIVAVIGLVVFFYYLATIFVKSNSKSNVYPLVKVVSVSFLVLFISFYIYNTIGKEFVENAIFLKVSGSGSADDRTDRAVEAFNALINSNWLHLILGHGPAAYDTLRFTAATLILYQVFALESGILGLFLFLSFMAANVYQTFFIKDETLRIIFLSSIIAALLHFIFIGNYYYPWLWALIILAQIVKQQQKSIS